MSIRRFAVSTAKMIPVEMWSFERLTRFPH
jgi:hypothetical protein